MFGREVGASRPAAEDAPTGSQTRPPAARRDTGVGTNPMEGDAAKAEPTFRFSETLKSTLRGPRVAKPQGRAVGGRPRESP
jgi:hypothetical protein